MNYFLAAAREELRPFPAERPLEVAAGCVARIGVGVVLGEVLVRETVVTAVVLFAWPEARNCFSASSQCSRSRPSGRPRSMNISYARRVICSWVGVIESLMCLAIVTVCIEIGFVFPPRVKNLRCIILYATVFKHPAKILREQWGENPRNYFYWRRRQAFDICDLRPAQIAALCQRNKNNLNHGYQDNHQTREITRRRRSL